MTDVGVMGRVLQMIAENQLRDGRATSFKEITQLGPPDELDKLLDDIEPELIRRGEDGVRVTFDGLARTEHYTEASGFIEHALRFLRDKLSGEPDLTTYSWADLIAGSKIRLADAERGTALLFLAGLAVERTGDRPGNYQLTAPTDIARLAKASDADELRRLIAPVARPTSRTAKNKRPQATPLVPSGKKVGVVNDSIGGVADDRLDVEEQVDIFAQAVVSKVVQPPLAIGLFGEWGSGKSFFMNMLRERIAARAKSGDDGKPERADAEHWGRVAQIEFNAWHYMDVDLWASLAGRIFEGLTENLPDGGETGADARRRKRRKLRERLASTCEAKEQAEAARDAAAAELTEARAAVARLRDERRKSFESAGGFVEELRHIIENDKDLAPARKALAGSGAKALGIEVADLGRLLAIPTEIDALVARAKASMSRARGLSASLVSSGWVWLLGAIAILAPLALSAITARISGVMAVGGQIGLGVVSLLGVAKRHLGQIDRALDAAESLQQRGAEIRDRALQRLEHDGEQSDMATALFEADARVTVGSKRVSELEATAAKLRDELQALAAGKLVYDFVAERGTEGGAYRSREGIVSIVRRDLETLSQLLEEWRSERLEAGHRPEAIEVTEARRRDFAIQRIVLYIDDLDRCPPERVVEVLQAVNLLLAFDLFVVVVGVDPRWLERSLENRFADLIGDDRDYENDDNGQPTRVRHHPAATARDYLEKIFQVPFMLLEVDRDGFEGLVRDHLPTREEIREKRRLEEERRQREAEASQATGAGRPTAANPGPLPDSGDEDAATTDPEPSGELYLEDHERAFAFGLYAFLPTPRLVKRFVNVYRLLRVAVPDDRYDEFARDSADAPHRVALLLLALNTGYPRVASALLRALAWPSSYAEMAELRRFDQLVDALAAPQSKLVGALELSPPQRDELETVLPMLRTLVGEVTAPLSVFETWAPVVGRYSMYWRGRQ